MRLSHLSGRGPTHTMPPPLSLTSWVHWLAFPPQTPITLTASTTVRMWFHLRLAHHSCPLWHFSPNLPRMSRRRPIMTSPCSVTRTCRRRHCLRYSPLRRRPLRNVRPLFLPSGWRLLQICLCTTLSLLPFMIDEVSLLLGAD